MIRMLNEMSTMSCNETMIHAITVIVDRQWLNIHASQLTVANGNEHTCICLVIIRVFFVHDRFNYCRENNVSMVG
jgi:hypothetical protein